jgi:Ca2+-binding RTX toxin-like protein
MRTKKLPHTSGVTQPTTQSLNPLQPGGVSAPIKPAAIAPAPDTDTLVSAIFAADALRPAVTSTTAPKSVPFGSGEELTLRGGATAPIQTLVFSDTTIASIAVPVAIYLNSHPAIKLQVFDQGGAATTSAATTAVLVTGSAAQTITAAAGTTHQSVVGTNGDLVYNAASNESLEFAGSGGDTVNTYGAGIATISAANSAVVNMSGAGMDFIGGNGNFTLNGLNNTGILAVADAGTSSDMVITGTGNDSAILNGTGTINGAALTGNTVLFGGAGPGVLFGGAGNDLFTTESGNLTMSGGGGTNSYIFIDNVQTSRTDLITDFNPNTDAIGLFGYGAEPAADEAALNSAVTPGGNTVVTLTDGTTILLAGAPTLHSSNFF